MATIKPAFKEDGVIHAGNASSDLRLAPPALLFHVAEKAKSVGPQALARVHTVALAGADP